jgi:hypothetical protein
MNLHENQKYDWVEDLERLVGNYNERDSRRSSPNLAEKGALQEAPAPGQGETSGTNMGSEFGLN